MLYRIHLGLTDENGLETTEGERSEAMRLLDGAEGIDGYTLLRGSGGCAGFPPEECWVVEIYTHAPPDPPHGVPAAVSALAEDLGRALGQREVLIGALPALTYTVDSLPNGAGE